MIEKRIRDAKVNAMLKVVMMHMSALLSLQEEILRYSMMDPKMCHVVHKVTDRIGQQPWITCLHTK